MSANFHTPLPDPVALTSANLESPLSQLDQGITDALAGDEAFSQLNLGSFTAKTISSGAIVGDATLVTIDTEGSASTDDLDTISSPSAGDVMFIKIANNSRVVTLRNNGGGTGNIRTYNALDFTLRSTASLALLVYNGSNWMVHPSHISRTTFPFASATISSGAIAFAGSYMTVDTEGSASTDDLDTISGGALGAFLLLSTSNSSRDVTLKHNTGNIMTATGQDVILNSSNKFVILLNNSLTWNMINVPVAFQTIQSNVTETFSGNIVTMPYNTVVSNGHPNASTSQPFLDLAPNSGTRQVRTLQGADTTLEGYGFGTQTVSGTPSNAFAVVSELTGSLVRFQSGASSGNLGGIVTPFTLTSIDNYSTFRIVFGLYSSIAVCRFWIGLSSAAIGNTDSPSSAGTHFMGVRYSTVVPDSFFQFVTSDGSTTTASSTAVAATINKYYELLINSTPSSVTLYFRNMASSTYASLTTSTTLPTSGNTLGVNARVETREAVAKSLQIYAVSLFH